MDQPTENATQPVGTAPRSKRDVEWFLGIVVALLLVVVAVPGIKPIEQSVLDDATVRGFEGLLLLARDEAVQTGDDHIVFFDSGKGSDPSIEGAPSEVMAWLIRDRDGDGRPSEAEYVASVPIDANGSVGWGSRFATQPAIGDIATTLMGPLSFGSRRANGEASALIFRQDGAPILAGSAEGADDTSNSSAGTVYLQSTTRDYAVVLSPWGDVDVQVWDDITASWQLATAD